MSTMNASPVADDSPSQELRRLNSVVRQHHNPLALDNELWWWWVSEEASSCGQQASVIVHTDCRHGGEQLRRRNVKEPFPFLRWSAASVHARERSSPAIYNGNFSLFEQACEDSQSGDRLGGRPIGRRSTGAKRDQTQAALTKREIAF